MTRELLPACSIPLQATVAGGAAWQQQHPTWLLDALRTGTGVDHGEPEPGRAYPVDLHVLGDLPLPDGRLIACDPYLAEPDQPAFTVTLPPGDHPVAVGIVRIGEDHIRPTALLLVTGTEPITRWSFAEVGAADEDPSSFGIGTVLGYGVDAGTGAFLSPAALTALVEVGREDGGMLEDPLSEAMDASPWEAALVPPRPGAPAVAQAHSGWGDGAYATWLGWNAGGGVSLVMTDFAVLTDPWQAADEDEPDDEPGPSSDAPPAPPVAPQRPTFGARLRRLLG